MKKLIIILFTILSISSYAQESFPTSNAIWNESVEGHYSTYGLLGDTIINDVLYSKLYEFSDTLLSEVNIKNYIGAFRNEGKKVWFKFAGYYGYYVDGVYIEEINPDILLMFRT